MLLKKNHINIVISKKCNYILFYLILQIWKLFCTYEHYSWCFSHINWATHLVLTASITEKWRNLHHFTMATNFVMVFHLISINTPHFIYDQFLGATCTWIFYHSNIWFQLCLRKILNCTWIYLSGSGMEFQFGILQYCNTYIIKFIIHHRLIASEKV